MSKIIVKSRSKCLSLYEKAKIIEEHRRGMSVTALSKKYGVAKSTICAIKKKSNKILSTVNNSLKPITKCTLKTSASPSMEKQLYKWFLVQREKHLPVSGEIIKKEALNLYSSINPNSSRKFSASDGWLQRFKNRYEIRLLKIPDSKICSQLETVDSFKKKISKIIEEFQFCENQIYNADEIELSPETLNPDTPFGFKVIEQPLTFLGCTNSTGLHKLKELVIGKVKNSKCLINFQNPVIYKYSKNARLTKEILKNWYFQQFVPEVGN